MKLKTGFALLTAGVLVIPILSVTLYFSAQRLITPETDFIRFVRKSSGSANASASAGETAGREREVPPEASSQVLLDENGLVAFSNVKTVEPGTKSSVFEVVRLLRSGNGKTMFFIQPIIRDGMDLLQIAAGGEGAGPPRPETLVYRLLLLFVVPLLIFTAMFATLFIRRLKQSTMALEAAALRISSGDLNSSVAIGGADELTEFSRSLDSMRSSLKEEFARRARFVMGVSHDLRTPLSNIRGYAEAIQDGMAGSDEERRKYASIIIDKSELLKSRIDELIEFMQMERGEWKLKNSEVKMGDFLAELCGRFEVDVQLVGKYFSHTLDIPGGLLVPMDLSQVMRVFENILGNAMRYSQEAGRLDFSAHMEDSGLVLRIGNDGPGIPQDELKFLFDPFYRGSRSRKGSGFGLGLSVAKLIIEAQGWSVGFSSLPGWTECAISIPSSQCRLGKQP
jgi:signal transduction histidine kinase